MIRSLEALRTLTGSSQDSIPKFIFENKVKFLLYRNNLPLHPIEANVRSQYFDLRSNRQEIFCFMFQVVGIQLMYVYISSS